MMIQLATEAEAAAGAGTMFTLGEAGAAALTGVVVVNQDVDGLLFQVSRVLLVKELEMPIPHHLATSSNPCIIVITARMKMMLHVLMVSRLLLAMTTIRLKI